MHGHGRSGGAPYGTAPTTSTSPPPGKSAGRGGKEKRSFDRLAHWVASSVLRRLGALVLMAAALYLALMLVLAGRWDLERVPRSASMVSRFSSRIMARRTLPPGSVYRSPEVFEKLLPFMQADRKDSNALKNTWNQKPAQKWNPCIHKRLSHSELPISNGYLIVEANGGLNQQRLSICDAVAVAGLLNATLVIPTFHLNSVWLDSSKFGDIFDEDYFIEKLKNHVRVVKELPLEVLERFDNNISSIVNMRTKALSSKGYYLQIVLPKLLELGAVRIAPFSNRLAHSVPLKIQALRCLTNFEALRFSEPIRALADSMVQRMINKSELSGGKYVSLHLRFEEDMVAFSCCTYDGGMKEKIVMDKVRERSWRGKFKRPGRKISPEANRRNGKCPLTPLEVGMMLRGMGFDITTSVYVASGKIYDAERYMAPLKQLFPLLETKETLASADELALFEGYSSRLAALDYTVCVNSEVFVTTQGGNFPHFLMGHRRHLNDGHAKTIKPDKRRLVLSFDNPNIKWEKFNHNMQEILHLSDLKGIALRKRDASVYTFPIPDCMCQQASRNITTQQV